MYNTLEEYRAELEAKCQAEYCVSIIDLFEDEEVETMFSNKEDISEAVKYKGRKYGLTTIDAYKARPYRRGLGF